MNIITSIHDHCIVCTKHTPQDHLAFVSYATYAKIAWLMDKESLQGWPAFKNTMSLPFYVCKTCLNRAIELQNNRGQEGKKLFFLTLGQDGKQINFIDFRDNCPDYEKDTKI